MKERSITVTRGWRVSVKRMHSVKHPQEGNDLYIESSSSTGFKAAFKKKKRIVINTLT